MHFQLLKAIFRFLPLGVNKETRHRFTRVSLHCSCGELKGLPIVLYRNTEKHAIQFFLPSLSASHSKTPFLTWGTKIINILTPKKIPIATFIIFKVIQILQKKCLNYFVLSDLIKKSPLYTITWHFVTISHE